MLWWDSNIIQKLSHFSKMSTRKTTEALLLSDIFLHSSVVPMVSGHLRRKGNE